MAEFDPSDCAERGGETGCGAEERQRALPLERRLSFHQGPVAVGACHVQRRGLERQRRLRFGGGGHRVDGADPQVFLQTTERGGTFP